MFKKRLGGIQRMDLQHLLIIIISVTITILDPQQ